MRLKTLEERYFIPTNIQEASRRIQKALPEVGLKNVVVKKQVPPRYLLVEYSPGWVGKAFEIEFLFEEKDGGTEVAVKWPYAKELPIQSESATAFLEQQKKSRRGVDRLLVEFRVRVGAVKR
jgi:hypothetical protein